MKKLLILGANPETVSLIDKAKEMGLFTIVTDNNPNAFAKQFADKSYDIDAKDINALSELVKREDIDGIVVGVAEALLESYCKLCQELQMPCYTDEKTIKVLTNKGQYKRQCEKYNLSTIQEYNINQEIKFPVIVKPIDSSGSKGISVCYNKDELYDAVKYAQRFSNSGDYLIEKYISGDEIVAYYVLQEGKAIFLGCCDRYVYHQQRGKVQLPVAYLFNSKYLDVFTRKFPLNR